jgi:hypothetical protein
MRAVLPQRFPRVRLTKHPEKTARLACKRPPSRPQSAGGPGTCAWFVLTHSEGNTRQGDWGITCQTVGKRWRRCLQERWPGCREQRPAPLQEQARTFGAQRRSYDQDEGIRGHCKRRAVVGAPPERAGPEWRSPRRPTGPLNGQQVAGFVRQQRPLPPPSRRHNISQGQGQHRAAPNGGAPVW